MTPIATVQALVEQAMRRSWHLGQTYWQLADSDFTSHHRKADETQAKFDALVAETSAALAQMQPSEQVVEALTVNEMVSAAGPERNDLRGVERACAEKWGLRLKGQQ